MKRWQILKDREDFKILNIQNLVNILLENRNIPKKEYNNFLNPKLSSLTLENSGLDNKEFLKFKKRLEIAIKNQEGIVIYGDYDVDGITGTAILWETLYTQTKNVNPYLPHRIEEGYGLSKIGIENVMVKYPDTKLLITVDNGIVANEAVNYAQKKGIDVIVTDHHQKGTKLPDAFCILHTTTLCGAGIAYLIARELKFETDKKIYEKLSLASLATIADVVPLTSLNRVIVKEGLKILKDTKRDGLLAIYNEAKIEKDSIGVYSIGHIIAPRLNASGRISNAMDALRLVCTSDKTAAIKLARLLSNINSTRQELTIKSFEHAKLSVIGSSKSKVLIVTDESYNPGVIGLIASKLVEEYYRPSFAISVGDEISKGSARSITGVNIIELLRSVSETLIEAGGHPMAAGFSVRTDKIGKFENALNKQADRVVADGLLERVIRIDMLLEFEEINFELFHEISKLEPYGMGNSEPVFATKNVTVSDVRKIGKDQNHLKMVLCKDGFSFNAIAFGFAQEVDVSESSELDIAYTIDINEWNGKKNIQLKLKDILLCSG